MDVEDVHRLGVAQRSKGGDVREIVEKIDPMVEAQAVKWFEPPLARGRGEAGRGLGWRRRTEEADVDPAGAQLEAEVEGRFGGARPLPVAEEVEDAHGERIAAARRRAQEGLTGVRGPPRVGVAFAVA
jgi:hypothetical protein